jgi:hypothetical protein
MTHAAAWELLLNVAVAMIALLVMRFAAHASTSRLR